MGKLRVSLLTLGLVLLGRLVVAAEAPPAADPERITKLCKQLGEGEYGNMGACEQLIQIGAPAMPQLIETLKDKRPAARWWAVAAVARITADEGYPALLKVLATDTDSFVRSTAVYYLRHYRKKGTDIWPEVEKALGDKDAEVARWALRLMVEDGYPDLDKKLREILAKGSSELRSYALQHVRDMGDRGKPYMPLVRQILTAEDWRIRCDAIHTTVALMDTGQLDFLRETFQNDKEPGVRECCLRCITVIPEPPVEAFELFVAGTQSDDEKVRDTASKLLTKAYKQYFGYDAKQPLPVREHAIKKWREWYEANRAKLTWDPERRRFVLPGEKVEKPESKAPKPKE